MSEITISKILPLGVVGRETRQISPATFRLMREVARIRELIGRAEAIKARGAASTSKLVSPSGEQPKA